MTTAQINVLKRNGRGKEPLNIDKIHSMVGYATQDITGVSASHVEMNSGIQFFDGIDTEDIQQILIKSASDRTCILISFSPSLIRELNLTSSVKRFTLEEKPNFGTLFCRGI